LAPEFYDTLYQTPSYVDLTWKYHFGDDQVQQALFDNEMHRNRQLDASTAGHHLSEEAELLKCRRA
jgi:hypothetical protein